jgi:hypothetical protein
MDALTASTAFATIVGLISNFRQERGAGQQLDHRQFIEWLEYHQHQDIMELILNTYHLQAEVDQLLRADHDLIIKKLDSIGTSLASLASHVAEFRPLALKLVPSAELSDQAVSILRQLVVSGHKEMFRLHHLGGSDFAIEGGNAVEFSEPRFLDDDMESLVKLDLLSFRQSNEGSVDWYGITRQAVRLIEAIDNQEYH